MPSLSQVVAAALALVLQIGGYAAQANESAPLEARLGRLAAEVQSAEDIRAIKKLQRAYGYYLDKGMWADLAELFTDDAVANYPAGVYIGKPSIAEHLFRNVGGGEMGEVGLREGRLYNHMSLQPVVHLDPGGQTAKGRWRVIAMFGSYGGGATWAEGVYEMVYAKDDGVWKIKTLDYHSGFGASYDTGWGAAPPPRAAGGGAGPGSAARGGRPPLAHAPDRPRSMPCEGFPAACLAPFHYDNPGTSGAGHVWTVSETGVAREDRGTTRRRLADLAHRATLLRDQLEIENLQRIYGYYVDRAMWDEAADLFADDGTIEIGLSGVYVGRARVREYLGSLGPHGLTEGWLNDHMQLQILVDVAADGRTAKARAREIGMTGKHQEQGTWSEGIYENGFVKQDGVWKIRSVHFYPTFIADYDKGWGKNARPVPAASTALPPDRPPTEVYEIYPKRHVPAYHYPNPVTGRPPQYPPTGGPSAEAAEAALAWGGEYKAPRIRGDREAALLDAERKVARVKDYHEIENLESAYGYYLDKNLWNDLADLFAADGSMELAQRGVYKGRERVRAFLLTVFGRGREGPIEGQLGNHIQLQPVIHVAEDGQTAKIRIRMLQQMSLGGRPAIGAAIYENEAVKEDGVWKFRKLHAYNTFTASYAGGWAKSANRGMPGPSQDLPPDAPPSEVFEMFPAVYPIPYHYANPVTGKPGTAFVAR
jgi:hypothetical protein